MEYEGPVLDMEVKGGFIELALCDTRLCGDRLDSLLPLRYEGAHAFLLCFSVDNPGSLEDVINMWDPQIKHYGGGDVPRFLVACKKDLRKDIDTIRPLERIDEALVSAEQGNEVARAIGATYLECSSRTGEGVREVFHRAMESMDARIKVPKYQGRSGFHKGQYRDSGCVVL